MEPTDDRGRRVRRWAAIGLVALLTATATRAADAPRPAATRPGATRPAATQAVVPKPVEGDWTTTDFAFRSGETLPTLRLHYWTVGTPRRDAAGHVANAVLLLHGTTGSRRQFFTPAFAGQLFGPGQLLDASRYYLILPDDIGHGQSSRPSEGMHAKFPAYRYADMVDAEHRLVVEGLHVDHLRLVIGTSMGGMHAWMWGETYPEMMDALMPLASEPAPIAGRNRMWRRMIADAIRDDPAWANGDYKDQPPGLRLAAEILFFMGSNPARRTAQYPTGDAAIKALETNADNAMEHLDANDVLYALESSLDYDPSGRLGAIRAPLVAVNSADDLINPPDQKLLERAIGRVRHGRAVILPEGPDTDGHGTHSIAKLWKGELDRLLRETERK